MSECTFVFIKPAGLEHYKEPILNLLSDAGLVIACEKHVPSREHMEAHYAEHRGKNFFEPLVAYHANKEVLALVLEAEWVVERVRRLCGATNPKDAVPGTIRYLAFHTFPDSASWTRQRLQGKVADNLVHSSDSVESAKREIKLWFPSFNP